MTGIHVTVLKLVVSHTFLYKKLDAFGHQHNGKILEMVKNESTRLLTVWNDVPSDESATVKDSNDVVDFTSSGDFSSTTSYEADLGRKIVFDNFDFMQKVHHMSEVHQM